MNLPIVAIIGRPNVGKSSLFNRLAKDRIAVVADEAGTTRDRLFREIETKESRFLLVDTGGLEFDEQGNAIEEDVQTQSRIAISEADMILFLVDAGEGITKNDDDAAEMLRRGAKATKPILFCASKADKPLTESQKGEFYALGFDAPLEISAMHNRGMPELTLAIEKGLKKLGYKKAKTEEEDETVNALPKMALVGKPNAGKSSIINAFLNEERLIVSDIPGTTRDAIDSMVRWEGKDFLLIDTAGIRRRGKIESGIEKFSVMRTIASLKRADVGVLVIDGEEGISAQDQHIAQMMLETGCGIIIAVNKWDTMEKGDEERERFLRALQRDFPFLYWAPVVFVSAKTKRNLVKIFPLVEEIAKTRKNRITTGKLNAFLRDLDRVQKPTGAGIVRPKILYLTQAEVCPPEVVLFVNKKKAFHFSYWRFFENRLREAFDFGGSPIRITVRERAPRKEREKAVKAYRREMSAPRTEGAPNKESPSKKAWGSKKEAASKKERAPRKERVSKTESAPKKEWKPKKEAAPKKERTPRKGGAPKKSSAPKKGGVPRRGKK